MSRFGAEIKEKSRLAFYETRLRKNKPVVSVNKQTFTAGLRLHELRESKTFAGFPSGFVSQILMKAVLHPSPNSQTEFTFEPITSGPD